MYNKETDDSIIEYINNYKNKYINNINVCYIVNYKLKLKII